MGRGKKKTLLGKACFFCNLGDDRELELGKLYTSDTHTVHYYCLLFSSGLAQNGDDDEGIMGFLKPDIEGEVKRGRKLSCSFCHRKGATIGCGKKTCRRTYHYMCGLKKDASFIFTDNFSSYCAEHRQYQQGIAEKLQGDIDTVCRICLEDMPRDQRYIVLAPCCNSFFHKLCVQNLCLNAGVYSKCPLCNDKNKFISEMPKCGIYIPEKDSSWELEPNAFQDLERRIQCDATPCKCPDGPTKDITGTRYEILLCSQCGSTGMHRTCGEMPFTAKEWICSVCAQILLKGIVHFGKRLFHRRNRRIAVALMNNLNEDNEGRQERKRKRRPAEEGTIESPDSKRMRVEMSSPQTATESSSNSGTESETAPGCTEIPACDKDSGSSEDKISTSLSTEEVTRQSSTEDTKSDTELKNISSAEESKSVETWKDGEDKEERNDGRMNSEGKIDIEDKEEEIDGRMNSEGKFYEDKEEGNDGRMNSEENIDGQDKEEGNDGRMNSEGRINGKDKKDGNNRRMNSEKNIDGQDKEEGNDGRMNSEGKIDIEDKEEENEGGMNSDEKINGEDIKEGNDGRMNSEGKINEEDIKVGDDGRMNSEENIVGQDKKDGRMNSEENINQEMCVIKKSEEGDEEVEIE